MLFTIPDFLKLETDLHEERDKGKVVEVKLHLVIERFTIRTRESVR